jgi:Zn-dependent M28 family amino/carboxypeptidase
VAIGRLEGEQLLEWLRDGRKVQVSLEADGSHAEEAVSDNVSITIPGPHGSGRALICGHYDTFWNTPGAYDNGSGTIALLHLAEYWCRVEPRRTVEIVFFTAEEWHLAGSRAYVESASPAKLNATDFVINLDGLGRGNFMEVSPGPEQFESSLLRCIRKHAKATDRDLELSSRFPPIVGTDHASFYAAGVPAVHLTFNDHHRLHQPNDLPNRGIASNIAWTVPLVERLVEELEPPPRPPLRQLL